jgi:AraC family transcriptional regulator
MRFETRGPDGIRAFIMPPGSQWVFPAGDEVVLRDLTPCHHVAASIDPAHFARLVGDSPLHFRGAIESRPLEYLVRALADEAAGGGPGGYAFAESLVLGIALQLRRHADNSGQGTGVPGSGARPPRRLPATAARRVLDLIEARVAAGGDASGLSIEELAREAGLSPSRFFRAFKATLGLPPHQYLLRRRLERARRLLDRPAARLADVALSTGFADQSHFTRLFRRQFGVTPGAVSRARRRRPEGRPQR